MKQLTYISLAILISLTFSLDADAQKKRKKKKKNKNADIAMDAITIQVDGMGCPFCAYGLEKKIDEMDGVNRFKIQMESGETTFTFPASDSLTIEQLVEKVNQSGYTPGKAKIVRADGRVEHFEKVEEIIPIDYEPDEMTTLAVYGNCKMCETRIEKAAMSLYGVSSAKWEEKTGLMKVSYLSTLISPKDIHLKIAASGHDTNKAITNEQAYDKLPECCRYKRADDIEIEYQAEEF